MVISSDSGLRCQGLYRGKVIQHLPHGRLKVFVYGVYPEELINQPDFLPICEQITPLWGGTYQGNGSFSYPNIGSTVWVQFANEDVNYPVVIGATLGGENAYNQYNNIKAQDEEISKKHMFTTGMAHFQMHESGKISAYVQQPYDNDVTIDFSNGDISCQIDADIAQKIEANEISHIVCQNIIDNSLNKGEISVSTHYYDPYSFTSSYFLSDTQEAKVSSLNIETSALIYSIRNNLGDIIDNEICSITTNEQAVNSNIDPKVQTTVLSTCTEKNISENKETTNINSQKDISLQNIYSKNTVKADIDALNTNLRLNIHDKEIDATNLDENHINDKRNIVIQNNKKDQDTNIFINSSQKELSGLLTTTKNNNNNIKNTTLSGFKNETHNNQKQDKYLYLYLNDTTKEVCLSNKNDNTQQQINNYIDNNFNNLGNIVAKQDLLSTYDNNETYLKVGGMFPYVISTQTYLNTAKTNNVHDNLKIQSSIENVDKQISTEIDILNPAFDVKLVDYNKNIDNIVQNYIDNDKNINLKTQLLTNIVSSEIDTEKATGNSVKLNDKSYNQLDINKDIISLGNLSTQDYERRDYSILEGSITEIKNITNNLTSDNKFTINSNNSAELLTKIVHNNNNESLSAKYFQLYGTATGEAIVELNNHEEAGPKNLLSSTIDKNTKLHMVANEADTSIEIKAINNIRNAECTTIMQVENNKIETYVIDEKKNTCKITMDTTNEKMIITANCDGGPCTITFDSSAGAGNIKIEASNKIQIIAPTDIDLKSNGTINLNADAVINVVSDGEVNVNAANSLRFNGDAVFTKNATFMKNVYVPNGNLTVPKGSVSAQQVNANYFNESLLLEN